MPLTSQKEVVAVLVESSTNMELEEGFQTGSARVIRAGANTLQFSGLKLNNMRTIKNEMRSKKLMKMEKFFIRIKLDTHTIETQSFKLVSSCTQLPKDIRDAVRPAKKRASISLSEGCAAGKQKRHLQVKIVKGSGSPPPVENSESDILHPMDGEELLSSPVTVSSPPSSPVNIVENEHANKRRNSAASINFLLS